MSTQNRSQRIQYPIGVVGLIIVAFVLRAGVAQFVDTLVSGSATWLPMFGTVGQTVVIYSFGVMLFTFVLVPVAVFWLGMRYGQQPE